MDKTTYYSLNIIRVVKSKIMRCAGHLARMGERRDVYMVLVGEPEGKTSLSRPRRRWEDNIVLKWVFTKCDVGHGLDRAGS